MPSRIEQPVAWTKGDSSVHMLSDFYSLNFVIESIDKHPIKLCVLTLLGLGNLQSNDANKFNDNYSSWSTQRNNPKTVAVQGEAAIASIVNPNMYDVIHNVHSTV